MYIILRSLLKCTICCVTCVACYICAYIFTVLCAHRLLSMNRHLGGARVKKCSQNNCLTVCKLDVFELIARGTD